MSDFKFVFSNAAPEPNEKNVSNRDVRSRATGCGSDASTPVLEEFAREILAELWPDKFGKPTPVRGDEAEKIAKEIIKK